MYTSQNNKALHHAVGSPMNPRRMVVLSHLKLTDVTINLTFLFFVCLLVFFSQFLENLKYQILYLTKPSDNRSKFK